MLLTLARIIKYGFQNFWRNNLVSVATIMVLLLATVVFQGLVLFSVIGQGAIGAVQDKIDISVYFKTSAPEDEMLKLKEALMTLAEVKSVDYTSKDDALKIFKERHKDDITITQALNQVGDNPLRASLNIKAKNPQKYSVIASFLKNDSFSGIIQEVSYSQNQTVIDRLAKVLNFGRQGGLTLTLLLALVAAIISFNTILLAVYSNREEIGIMRLVGASNAFIRGPYLFVGILYGLSAAILTVILITPFVYWISPYVSVFIPGMYIWHYFVTHIFSLLGYDMLFGVGIGTISSMVVIKRYLQV